MHTKRNIAVIGLGLIGASIAKAFKKYTDNNVFGYDINPEIITQAKSDGVIDGEADIQSADVIISALYPKDTVRFVKSNAALIKKGALVTDCGGTKELVCRECVPVAEKYGFEFVGAHPMAGTEHSGYAYAKEDMFVGASLIICSNEKRADMEQLFSPIGFKTFKYTTSSEHDRVIAFTSQLAHVVSNAFVKSRTYPMHHGFSAGSLKDLTRVAWLNEGMWTELFFENSENLANEIDTVCENLKKYSDALRSHDADGMRALLSEGRRIKEDVDGR